MLFGCHILAMYLELQYYDFFSKNVVHLGEKATHDEQPFWRRPWVQLLSIFLRRVCMYSLCLHKFLYGFPTNIVPSH